MKRFSKLILAGFLVILAIASNAQGINFQGVARSANGTIIASSNISLRLSIISKNVDATPEYVETKTVVTNAQGIFTVVVGDATNATVVGSFKTINWAESPKFLKVEMDPSAGTNYINMGATQLQYVPYAYYSLGVAADNVTGILPVTKGGTGVSSLANLKTALNISNIDTTSLSNRINSITAISSTFSKDITVAGDINLGGQINYPSKYNNTSFGRGALASIDTAVYSNTAFGTSALNKNKTGFDNTAFGMEALSLNVGGNYNTAVGRGALLRNTASENTAIGKESLGFNTTGSQNTAVGTQTMYSNTTGSNNIALGKGSLNKNTTGGNNISIGYNAMNSNVGNSGSIAIGYNAMFYADDRTTGRPTNNTAIGYEALKGSATAANNTGTGNTAIGVSTLLTNTSGANNTAVGGDVLKANTTGYQNAALGNGALASNTTGYNNVAIGFGTAGLTREGPNNVAIGYYALRNNVSGSRNVAVGVGTLQANLGSVNNAVGYLALLNNTTASENNAFGHQALEQNTTGSGNAGFGHNVMQANLVGVLNTAMGYAALKSNLSSYNSSFGSGSLMENTTGTQNAAFGEEALTVNTTGSNLAAFGAEAGKANTTGSNNTYIGANANTSSGTISNSTAIGFNAQVTASNQIQLGNADVTVVKSAGVLTSSRGLLPPKFSAVQRDAIVNPEQGLTIYCYNCGTYGELEVFNGNAWVNAAGGSTATAITDVTAGLVASFPLDGTPSGTNTTTAIQVSTVTKAMNTGWTYTLPATDPNKTYKMVVSGTWGIANGVAHRDPAYDAINTGTPIANRGCDANWTFEGACAPPVPTSPAGYSSNHIYEYYLGNGKSGGYVAAFTDGAYGDNVGSLTFTLYEVGIAGSTSGTVTYTTNRRGVANSAMQGGSGYITAPSSIFQFTRSQEFTVSVWFTADAVASSGRLLSTENSEGNFRISKYDLNNVSVQYGDYITQGVTNNDWHHLVYTYNNRLEKVYIDGVLIQTNTDNSTEALTYGAPFTIGAKAASAFDKWAGKIDDVKVYNRALLPNEVMVLFNQ